MATEDHNYVSIMKKLDYTVYKCSSFSASFIPQNIQENKATDQTSRWSSETNNPPQFLVLKLTKLAIVKTITFGKYEKNHVCNLKKFKVFGGLMDGHMIELLDTCHPKMNKYCFLERGLRNDNVEETFCLKHTVGGKDFPCRFLKIMPLQSWGPCFNFSIWFVELNGIVDPDIVDPALEWFKQHQKRESIRLCLKHFRQLGYSQAFETLQAETGVQLEDPLLSELHSTLVQRGDYEGAERFMDQALSNGMLNSYIGQQEYRASWRTLASGERPQPGMRGGHQMCMDPHSETIYLLGGWDGNQDLSDLWAYHVPTRHWTLISHDTEMQGGPSARSCHKMCLDPERRQIFTLGRYLDTQYRTLENLKSDFYVYDIESNHWTLITEDTAALGGPQLIFDHQMCMDVAARTIYVFGGRVLTVHTGVAEERPGCVGLVGSSEPIFSGLYSYHVATNVWRLLCSDTLTPPSPSPALRSRVGHSMLFHPVERKLFIFAGQRSKEYLNDFLTYDVDTGLVRLVSDGSRRHLNSLPAAGFTQRATIDPDLDEIYVLSGLSKDKEKRDDNVQNSFWVYYIKQDKWSCVYQNENTGEQYWNKMQHVEPCPRFAHQLVYDHVNKVHYLFGGNPGRSCLPKLRLDDFWRLSLTKPSHTQLLQRCKLLVRTFRYQELAMTESLTALQYLQTTLSEIIDHEDQEQTKQFQQLASLIFQEKKDAAADDDCHSHRCRLYEQLAQFFPETMTQPKANLLDLVPL